MSSKAQELALRRVLLQRRSAALRNEVAHHGQALQPWLSAADTVRGFARWMQKNPLWVGAVVTTLVVLKPKRSLALGLKLWTGWRWWGRAKTAWTHATTRR